MSLSASAPSPRAAIPDEPVFLASLETILAAEKTYLRAMRLTGSIPGSVDPEQFCRDLLARALGDRAYLVTDTRRRFFGWAIEKAQHSRLVPVLAAHDYFVRGETGATWSHAKRALSLNQDDLYAQRLYERSQPVAPRRPDVRDRFCPHPFERLETQSDDRVFFCCPAWLPKPIGSLAADSPEAVWNSTAAQDIRRSVLDGSFRYCSRMHCPRLTMGNLPRSSEVTDPEHRETITTGRTVLPYPPRRLAFSHDRSCNLSCPSCRTAVIVAKKAATEGMNSRIERILFPLVRKAGRVQITGSGDPFASPHYRWVIRRLTSGGFPGVRLDLQTNGLLFKSSWDDLGLEGYAETALISIDAARPETYVALRRGGGFDRLKENLAFVSELRRAGKLKRVRLDFVVQAGNFEEMPEAADLMRGFGFDGIKFQMIRSWNTYSPEEFARHDIGRPDHPEFGAFLAVLDDERLAGADVEFYGFHSVPPHRLTRRRTAEHSLRSGRPPSPV